MSHQCSVAQIVEDLKNVTTGMEGYSEVLEKCRWNIQDFEKYEFFSDEFYTRNLIHRCDEFALVVLCWKPGQKTPIHDHSDADGWLRVIYGEIEEGLYSNPLKLGEHEPRFLHKKTATPNAYAHINDDMGLHDIANNSAKNALSLHLYAPSFESCKYFCPDTKEFKVKELSYHSIHGKLVAPKVSLSAG